MAIILDIETVAIDDMASFIEPAEPAKNLKDPEKIAADIAKKQSDQVERASLYPWTCRAIAIGWCHEGDEVPTVRACNGDAIEADVLREFLSVVYDGYGHVMPIVTFAGLGFDLPVVMARSRLLGVTGPGGVCPDLNIDRYRSPHPDLLQILTFRGAIPSRSLRWFAQRFNLNTDDAFSGKEIAQLHAAEDWDSIRKHCESDVTLTRQLAERMGVIKPRRMVAA